MVSPAGSGVCVGGSGEGRTVVVGVGEGAIEGTEVTRGAEQDASTSNRESKILYARLDFIPNKLIINSLPQ